MKGTTALPKTWKGPKPARAETESLIEDGEAREFHQGTGIDHEHDPVTDAGYMAATFPSADQRVSPCIAGRTIYGRFVPLYPVAPLFRHPTRSQFSWEQTRKAQDWIPSDLQADRLG